MDRYLCTVMPNDARNNNDHAHSVLRILPQSVWSNMYRQEGGGGCIFHNVILVVSKWGIGP